jgi:hypothetical protein
MRMTDTTREALKKEIDFFFTSKLNSPPEPKLIRVLTNLNRFLKFAILLIQLIISEFSLKS